MSALMREDEQMKLWLSGLAPDDRIVTCTIAQGEVLFGLERLELGRRRMDLETKAQSLWAVLPCPPVPPEAAAYYASLKIKQQHRGLPLDENDLWIAATALAIQATLVTRDSDFHRLDAPKILTP